MKTKNILLIEDDETISEIYKEVLVSADYEVECAFNGKEALELLQSKSDDELPSMILLDLTMPVMSGTEFRMIQRDDENLKHIPVVVLSGDITLTRGLSEDTEIGYLKKPAGIDEILNAVRITLKRNEKSKIQTTYGFPAAFSKRSSRFDLEEGRI